MSPPDAVAPSTDTPERRILYCHCAFARVVDENAKAEVLAGLADSGVAFDAVPDLCELAARRDPTLARLAASGDVELVACYPRAVRWLFHAADSPLPEEGVTIHNMREDEPATILGRVLDGAPTDALKEGAA
ncbi:MAG: hypothetical protein AAGE94_25400 [Acidobacteriota bacterium]